MQTAIIVNRNAGSMRRDPALAARIRGAYGRTTALFLTGDGDELSAAAAEAARCRATTVAILGGDGTASATLTALWRAYGDRPLPAIALLRGGTMNTIATSLGVSQASPRELLRRTVQATQSAERARGRTRPSIRIGERLGFLFGTGVWYGYIAESYANGQPTRWTNAKVLGRTLASAALQGETFRRVRQTRTLSVRFEGGDWEPRPYLTIAAGTIADAGFGFQPFPRAFAERERFELLAIKGSALEVLKALPGVWWGRGIAASTAYGTVTSWAELRSEDGPFGYSVDGDVATAQATLRLELGPSFRFLCI